MPIKTDLHIIKGMQKDISVSKANAEFAFDAMNIRLTAREGNTLLSVTNEKGNKEVPINTLGEAVIIEGIVIGKEIINNYLILFTTSIEESPEYRDRIYRLEKNTNEFICTILYKGDLNFDIEHPIESIGVFENKEIQKVYWIDGKNPVRYINITKTYINKDNSIFDIVPTLKLNEIVNIESVSTSSGSFPSGTVQYVFTYCIKNGAESNIFYQSPLYYSHSVNRGGSPEELSSNSFKIEIKNTDLKFENIRIYSILRTSIDAVPTVKLVTTLNNSEYPIYYNDFNTSGELIDPTFLLYVGGENIIPECITHKDNTLFLGNYKLSSDIFSKEAKEAVKGLVEFKSKSLPRFEYREGYYDYSTQLEFNSYQITTLKLRETYRFGIQFQNKIGRWSEVLWVGDQKVDTDFSPSSEIYWGSKSPLTLVCAQYNIPKDVIDEAISKGYIKARGVMVYPEANDRDIICQGVLNPTVFKYDDRESNSPYAQSSWFFRPFHESIYNPEDDIKYGSFAVFEDMDTIDSSWGDRDSEIGCTLSYNDKEGNYIERRFYVDSSIVTMHSPDIEFDSYIDNLNNASLECKIVGYVNLHSGYSVREVESSTLNADVNDYGFYSRTPKYERSTTISTEWGGRMLLSGINWIGSAINESEDSWIVTGKQKGWLVSPWQRSGSLINDFARRKDDITISKLKHNRLINTRVSYATRYNYHWTPINGISNIIVHNTNEPSIDYISRNGERLSYYGNINKILVPGNIASNNGYSVSYVENVWNEDTQEYSSVEDLYEGDIENTNFNSSLSDEYKYSTSPVEMKYKSSKHIVFAFNKDTNNNRVILPSSHPTDRFTKDNTAVVSHFDVGASGLWLAELCRTVSPDSKFGGNNEYALTNNRWTVAGEALSILDSESVTIQYLQGDTYYQRYDCLKTYPYTFEDENNVTDVLSFYCETRVNIDGRYDRNRGNINSLALSPNNFNLLNPVYSQKNNYFNYFVLDSSLKINDFNNSLTWSKEKSLGEDIDQWTNITLASTLELDGDKGEITALKTFNNEIFCFQKQGISNILFNSRVQIPTSDGVPIEITNGLKVQGKRYLSSIGCSNKWSIAESPIGLYFIDSNTDEIYLFNGQITSLSTQLGFSSYAKEHNHLNKWNPITFDNFRTHYDKSNRDVYFTDKNSCLVYSESLGQFTSFMSYEETPYMFNIDNSFYAIKNNKIWEQFAGDYNSFYGGTKPYSITVVSNPDSFYDKIFNTVEFRADTWDNDKLLNSTFDTLEVWNEYQHGKSNLTNILGKPSPLKRKFRVWRANIPRDISNNRDRIRNTWAYIKLEHSNPSNYKTEFHDLMVHYFI